MSSRSILLSAKRTSERSRGNPREVAARLHALAALAQAGLPLEFTPKDVTNPTALERMISCVLVATRECGAPLVQVAGNLTSTCDRLVEQQSRIAESLAGPRMARRILVWLPVAAVPLTLLMGFDVFGVLFGSLIGWVLLGMSGVLSLVATLWSKSLIRKAEHMAPAPGLYARLMGVGIDAGLGWSAADSNCLRALAATETLDLLDADEVERASVARLEMVHSGIPLRGVLGALESAAVDEAFLASSIRVRELGEKLLLPLGACTLPAFMCVGVFPALISVISNTVRDIG